MSEQDEDRVSYPRQGPFTQPIAFGRDPTVFPSDTDPKKGNLVEPLSTAPSGLLSSFGHRTLVQTSTPMPQELPLSPKCPLQPF